MKFLIVSSLVAGVLAMPAVQHVARQEVLCPTGLYSTAQCCGTDVLGVADLDCQSPSSAKDIQDFKSSCSAAGKLAKCCAIPVAGQSVLCVDSLPASNNPGGGNNPGGNNPGGNNPGSNHPGSGNNDEPVCPKGLYSNPQCCSTDVLGVADLDCNASSSAKNVQDFKSSCSAVGKIAKCCVIPVAGQSLLCTDTFPGGNNPGGNHL